MIGLPVLLALYDNEIKKLQKEYPNLTPKQKLAWFNAKTQKREIATVIDTGDIKEMWNQTDFDPKTDTKLIL